MNPLKLVLNVWSSVALWAGAHSHSPMRLSSELRHSLWGF